MSYNTTKIMSRELLAQTLGSRYVGVLTKHSPKPFPNTPMGSYLNCKKKKTMYVLCKKPLKNNSNFIVLTI